MRVNALVVDLALLGPGAWEFLERRHRRHARARRRGLHRPLDRRPARARAAAGRRRLGHQAVPPRGGPRARRGRRAAPQAGLGARRDGPLVAGELEIRADQFQAFAGGRSVDLTRREFEVLQLLAQAEGKVLQREEIYQEVWGYAMAHGDRSVDVFIRKVRQKLEGASPDWQLHPHALRGRLPLRPGAGRPTRRPRRARRRARARSRTPLERARDEALGRVSPAGAQSGGGQSAIAILRRRNVQKPANRAGGGRRSWWRSWPSWSPSPGATTSPTVGADHPRADADRGDHTEPEATPRPSRRRAEPEVTRIAITGGVVEGGPKTIEVSRGDTVRIVVQADAPDEIHLHGYDIDPQRRARASRPASSSRPTPRAPSRSRATRRRTPARTRWSLGSSIRAPRDPLRPRARRPVGPPDPGVAVRLGGGDGAGGLVRGAGRAVAAAAARGRALAAAARRLRPRARQPAGRDRVRGDRRRAARRRGRLRGLRGHAELRPPTSRRRSSS